MSAPSQHSLRDHLAERSVAGSFAGLINVGLALSIVGVTLFAVMLAMGNPDRAWHLFHVNWLYFTGLSGGSVALVAVHKIANAKWSGLLIRFAEGAAAFFPVSLIGLVLIFTVGYDHIYGHMHEQLHTLSHGKALWLSHGFMFARLGIGLTVLYFVGWRLIRADMVPDMSRAKAWVPANRRELYAQWTAGYAGNEVDHAANEERIHRLAPLYVVLYSLVFTMVAFDGIMALQPHWFSNLLGGWYFMGSFLGGHTLLALLMLYGAKHIGIDALVSPKQRHDLGKLIFGFTVFWTYLMWAQFLVIWYGNMPEETGFVFARLWGPWRPVGAAVFIGMFLVPFSGLIGVLPKKTPFTLGLFATVSLLALWLERYLLVVPSVTAAAGPMIGVPEIAATVLMGGLFLFCYGLFARTFPMVSPRLAEITLAGELHHGEEAAEFLHEEAPEDFVDEATIERERRHLT